MKKASNARAMGILLSSVLAGTGMLSVAPARAADDSDFLGIPGEISGNVAFVTDYRFRGITQSDEDPALQGGLDYSVGLTDSIGMYLGVWASSVNFNDGDQATVEIDYYGGFTYELSGFSFDLGAIYYSYPAASSSLDYDYIEFAISVGYSPIESVSLSVGYNYSPDYFAGSGDFHYPNAEVEFTPDLGIPVPITLAATVGYSLIDDEAAFGARDYVDWTAGISTEIKGVTLGVYYVDNDLSGSFGDATAVFKVGMNF
jgi:uncharacterized protein (TIGR02001 family)